MRVNVVGAGMAGLLAANMLRQRHEVTIWEQAESLPNNHSAVLRFRSSVIGDLLGIEFKKVNMLKDTLRWRNPVADAIAYSRKCTGIARSDRSVIGGLVSGERYIAPPDFIARMAEGAEIYYNAPFDFDAALDAGEPVISTIPMNSLMKVLHYPFANELSFRSVAGINVRAHIYNCDAYVTLYTPFPDFPFSRISITGDEFIGEIPRPNGDIEDFDYDVIPQIALGALSMLGIEEWQVSKETIRHYTQRYAKILPTDDGRRRAFIHWASDKHNIFSLGRFATWRPNLLLDDLVNDVRLIEKWLGNRYSMMKHR